MSPTTRQLGTQQVLEPGDIGPPDYELMAWQIDETIDCLLDAAVDLGERHSQSMIAAGRGPTPFAHRATSAYHAIEVIRFYQQRVQALEEELGNLHDRYDNSLLERNGDDA